MWSEGCSKSNVWVAEVRRAADQLALANLSRVQRLRGEGRPFLRLTHYISSSNFNAVAIDAPFSIPSENLGSMSHRALLERISGLSLRDGRPFPSAADFISCVLEARTTKKPLRKTEEFWRQRKVNVRSTMWAGARGGAAMTAACLRLQWETGCSVWPWEKSPRGLLVEAFPAAQLCHWDLPHQEYSRNTERETKTRCSIVESLTARIDFNGFRKLVEASADALDAVICAFAAVAVVTGRTFQYPDARFSEEGLIAVEASGPVYRTILQTNTPKH